MSQVLITGVAGFIGSKIASRFLQEGYNVFGVDDLSSGLINNIPKEVEFIEEDLANESVLNKLPKCKLILHLAGQSSGEISFDNPILDLEKNTISLLNLIKYSIQNNIEKIIYASSMSVYGNVLDLPTPETNIAKPLSCYGVGKKASENYLYVFKDKFPSISFRMFNVYGPGQNLNNLRQGMVSIFLAQALKNNYIEIKGSISRFRDFIYIDDVVDIWFKAANMKLSENLIINLGTGVKTTVRELADQICALVPNTTYFESNETPGDQNGIYADIKLLKNLFNYENFINIEDGLKKFYQWAKNNNF